jgi:hypothetical protein
VHQDSTEYVAFIGLQKAPISLTDLWLGVWYFQHTFDLTCPLPMQRVILTPNECKTMDRVAGIEGSVSSHPCTYVWRRKLNFHRKGGTRESLIGGDVYAKYAFQFGNAGLGNRRHEVLEPRETTN